MIPTTGPGRSHANGVTVLNFLPGWLEMLVEVGDGRLQSVRAVPTGGDWVRTAMVRRLQSQAPRVRLTGLGGATETAVHATLYEAKRSAGFWHRCAVRDSVHEQCVPRGEFVRCRLSRLGAG